MRIIIINGCKVEVSVETLKRIEKIARAKKLGVAQAIEVCLEKVI